MSNETMPSGQPTQESSGPPEGGVERPDVAVLRGRLEKAKKSVLEAIRDYPRPIAGCDQQFNYLLEERDRIAAELSRLAADRSDGDGREPVSHPGG